MWKKVVFKVAAVCVRVHVCVEDGLASEPLSHIQ